MRTKISVPLLICFRGLRSVKSSVTYVQSKAVQPSNNDNNELVKNSMTPPHLPARCVMRHFQIGIHNFQIFDKINCFSENDLNVFERKKVRLHL